jgi:hypothetical protein
MEPRRPEGDWGFRAEDPGGALGGYVAHWCFWWDDGCQDRFARLWGRDADEVADELADRYGFGWPWLAPRVLPTRAPTTQARIEGFLPEDWLVARTDGTYTFGNPVGTEVNGPPLTWAGVRALPHVVWTVEGGAQRAVPLWER